MGGRVERKISHQCIRFSNVSNYEGRKLSWYELLRSVKDKMLTEIFAEKNETTWDYIPQGQYDPKTYPKPALDVWEHPIPIKQTNKQTKKLYPSIKPVVQPQPNHNWPESRINSHTCTGHWFRTMRINTPLTTCPHHLHRTSMYWSCVGQVHTNYVSSSNWLAHPLTGMIWTVYTTAL